MISKTPLSNIASQSQHTQLLKFRLVTFTGGDSLLLSLGLSSLRLKSGDPTITLRAAGGLESVFLATHFELELIRTLFSDVGNFSL